MRTRPSNHTAREPQLDVVLSPSPAQRFVIETMHARILTTIRKIPRGKVSTYGAIARAAGYPGAAIQVVGALHRSFDLPWQRVLGAGGEIKLRGDSALEQRFRLESEGVTFRGRRVDMKQHEFKFPRKKKKAKKRSNRDDQRSKTNHRS